ncbi:adenine-specific methyltransferase EcoRI family protein [uncultured Finegoldia sp.]|uniref:adenine-specific methyltransferase EcoRI family protein n=1 Tax=uncultured Finegoldia sp. TaxID=328009 RepID=UPI00261B5905|nr:adenine-specific methyltransferase EcoRI family protein [uncultured Finegoldia sp.]
MRNNSNDFLRKAKKNKNDEFYTQMVDIQRELEYYTNQFNSKIVYCNCDDPTRSNFYKFFAENFHKLGLKKLISSCYVENEINLLNFNKKHFASGFYYEYTGKKEEKLIPTKYDLIPFRGDGDFRSQESIELLKKSDVVVTNPPFSLFREHIEQIMKYDKEFLVIGNINAITYKSIFNLIQHNKAWMGVNMGRGISGFIVPEYYELYGTETKIDDEGNRIISTNNNLWLTNLDNEKRHTDIPLTQTYNGNETMYPKYDNYDGINVNKTVDIPKDYNGAMGVPITFLHKFNPEQFEIIKFRKGNDNKDLSVDGRCPYFRILIKNKRPNI